MIRGNVANKLMLPKGNSPAGANIAPLYKSKSRRHAMV